MNLILKESWFYPIKLGLLVFANQYTEVEKEWREEFIGRLFYGKERVVGSSSSS